MANLSPVQVLEHKTWRECWRECEYRECRTGACPRQSSLSAPHAIQAICFLSFFLFFSLIRTSVRGLSTWPQINLTLGPKYLRNGTLWTFSAFLGLTWWQSHQLRCHVSVTFLQPRSQGLSSSLPLGTRLYVIDRHYRRLRPRSNVELYMCRI